MAGREKRVKPRITTAIKTAKIKGQAMSIMMGIMVVFMVAGIISGHRHMMGGMMGSDDKAEKVEQSQESPGEGPEKRRICDDCPGAADMKDGVEVRDEGPGKTKTGEESGK